MLGGLKSPSATNIRTKSSKPQKSEAKSRFCLVRGRMGVIKPSSAEKLMMVLLPVEKGPFFFWGFSVPRPTLTQSFFSGFECGLKKCIHRECQMQQVWWGNRKRWEAYSWAGNGICNQNAQISGLKYCSKWSFMALCRYWGGQFAASYVLNKIEIISMKTAWEKRTISISWFCLPDKCYLYKI